ncbi:hypothetical protein ACF0H5_006174 [Mactra antiquata]
MDFSISRWILALLMSLLWILCHIHVTSSEIITANAVVRHNFANKNDTYRMLWSAKVRAAPFCVMECARDIECASALYNKVTKICQGHSVTLGNPAVAFDEPNTQYFLKPFGEHYIGDSCATTTDCWTINTECRQGLCSCLPGYSFSPKTQECKVCDQYDNQNFMAIENHFLSKSNVEEFSPVTVEECIQLCVNRTDYLCVTFEFWLSDSCALQNVTVLDLPHKWFEDKNLAFNISHYQRDCA